MENTSALTSVNFQHSALTKGEKKKRSLGHSTIKAAPSSHAKIHSGKSWDFCDSTLLPACSSLCVYLCLISTIPNMIIWFMSKHSHKLGVLTHTFPILLTSRVSALIADPAPPPSPPPPIYMCVCACLCVGVNVIFPSVFLRRTPFTLRNRVSPPPRLWKMGSHEKAISFKT